MFLNSSACDLLIAAVAQFTAAVPPAPPATRRDPASTPELRHRRENKSIEAASQTTIFNCVADAEHDGITTAPGVSNQISVRLGIDFTGGPRTSRREAVPGII